MKICTIGFFIAVIVSFYSCFPDLDRPDQSFNRCEIGCIAFEGTVRYKDGFEPIADVRVALNRNRKGFFAPFDPKDEVGFAITDQDGRYMLEVSQFGLSK